MQVKKAEQYCDSRVNLETQTGPTEIPLTIGCEIVVRSLSNPAHRTKTAVIGAVPNEFIFIRKPVLAINDRISTCIEDDFVCSYFDAGYLYTFRSRCSQNVLKDIICIDYPDVVEVKQIRKHRRIKVNIETEFFESGSGTPIMADIKDISHGGCCLTFKPLAAIVQGMYATLTFCLPNEQMVRKLKSQVMNVRNFRSRDTTEAGMRFIGPPSELEKVTGFCEFCLFFEIE